MSTSSKPRPADIAACASAAVRSLTDEQLTALIASSRKMRKHALARPWETVKTAAPDLADALDDLHRRETAANLPRCEALAADHEMELSRAIKGPQGQTITLLVLAAVMCGAAAGILGFTGTAGTPVVTALAVLAAGLLVPAYVTGRRLSTKGNWLFADPEAAASIVWGAGIDAAAVTALKEQSGRGGLTSKTVQTLASAWARAGLETSRFEPPPKPVTALNPFMLASAHKIHVSTGSRARKEQVIKYGCTCGQTWDSGIDQDNELSADVTSKTSTPGPPSPPGIFWTGPTKQTIR